MPRTANDYARSRWLKYHRGQMSASEKRFHREMQVKLTGWDELSLTASRWLAVQRANHLWPRSPRTSAWGQRYENNGHRWGPILP